MATEARVSFIDQLRKKLSSEITVDQMTSVLAAVSDVMMHFDINEIPESDLGGDDLLKQYVAALTL